MASKKELDQVLTELQAIQRKCFKSESRVSLDIHPQTTDVYSIHVTAYNEDKPYVTTNSDGEETTYTFECFQMYGFWSHERNLSVLKLIEEYLGIYSDEQH